MESPLSPQQLTILRSHIDPLHDCRDFGVGLYLATQEVINTVTVSYSSTSDSN